MSEDADDHSLESNLQNRQRDLGLITGIISFNNRLRSLVAQGRVPYADFEKFDMIDFGFDPRDPSQTKSYESFRQKVESMYSIDDITKYDADAVEIYNALEAEVSAELIANKAKQKKEDFN